MSIRVKNRFTTREHCPDFLKNKWPVSNQKGIKPIGEACPFAHHAFHIASQGFKHSNTKLKEDLIKKLKADLTNPAANAKNKSESWNPAGNNLAVSARYANIRDARAAYNKDKDALETEFNKRAKKRNEKLKQSTKVLDKMKEMKQEDDNYRLKMGYLNRAKVLYDKRRFKEAFDTIIKAVAIVKKEEERHKTEHEKLKKRLKKKLDLSFDAEINPDILLRLQSEVKKPKKSGENDEDDYGGNDERDQSLEEFKDLKFQKLVYFAEKTGVIGQKNPSMDQDLKDEIEDL